MNGSLLSKTKQSWKFKAMFVALMLAAASMAYGQLHIGSLSSSAFFYLVAGGAFLGVAAFAFACVSIKCPVCGSKWLWQAVSGQGHKDWLFWLHSQSVCPNCGEPRNE